MEFQLDPWQIEVLGIKGNLCICSGRQVGKSTVIAIKAGANAVKEKKSIMIIAHVERQALLLFEKVLSYIYENNRSMIKKGKDKPTKHEIKLKNGSIIRCLPTGDSGYGIRGFTIDELYADEAHFIGEDVWAAVTPMLATTGGSINLLSTPQGTEGYFYRMFHDKGFKSFHVNTEEVAQERPEPQRTLMLEFLKNEKERMTKLQYQQEYLGLFVGGIQRFFPDDLIEECCKISKAVVDPVFPRFQGIDIARMGGDDCVFVTVAKINDRLIQIDMLITEEQRLTETARLIIHRDKTMNHKKIYIDDGGLGVGVYDILFEDPQTKRKVVGINNARRNIDKEKGQDNFRKRTLMKEDLYNNLKVLMETGGLELFDNPELRQSLRSIQYENGLDGLKIYGSYTHITEALIRAAWCVKDKSLKLWIRS